MDVISYGVANQAGKEEKKTRTTLGSGVEGFSPHVKERIDKIEKSIAKVTEKANKLIVNDTINIMKANAKLNTIAKTSKYKMHNMIFDDLLDLSGIDTAKSSGYTHDAVNGLISGGIFETKTEVADAIPKRIILTIEEEYSPSNIDATAKMTSNNAPRGIVSGSSFQNGTYDFFKAFDDNTSTSWITPLGIKTGSLSYDFGLSKVIVGYKISKLSYSGKAPKDWTFSGSNDGVNWTTLDTRSNVTDWSSAPTKTFSFVNSSSFKIYKINITANNGDGSNVAIDEMELYEQSAIGGTYSVSRNNGEKWEPIIPETLFYFSDSVSALDNKIRVRAELPSGTKLLNYALTWA